MQSIDMLAKKAYTYVYEDGKLMRAKEFSVTVGANDMLTSRTLVAAIAYTYNADGQVTEKKVTPADGGEMVYTYAYPVEGETGETRVTCKQNGKSFTSVSKNDSSYYYDDEIGMYYLQSRYYDPSVGRFVNADTIECATFNTTSLVSSLYCYCCNNPENETDYTGNVIWSIIEKILVGISKGVIKQFCIDSIEWAIKYYFVSENAVFKPSKVEDYVASILTEIFNEFKLSNIVGLAASLVVLFVKYLPKIIMGRMKQADWSNLLLDILAIVLTFLLKNSLKN